MHNWPSVRQLQGRVCQIRLSVELDLAVPWLFLKPHLKASNTSRPMMALSVITCQSHVLTAWAISYPEQIGAYYLLSHISDRFSKIDGSPI
jgi:hypothetical protein